MKIIYSGSPAELLPKERAKIEGKLAKVGKIIEKRGEKEVHIILSQERRMHNVEITMQVYGNAMVGVGSDGELASAMGSAIEKLEKQILKLRTKRRDTHRQLGAKKPREEEPAPAAPVAKGKADKKKTAASKTAPVKANPKVFRVNHQDGGKPMTLDEAMLEMTDGHDYLVYRDAKTDRVCTLLRRSDGHLDLIES
jgi:putative sigma-54 modulation protein